MSKRKRNRKPRTLFTSRAVLIALVVALILVMLITSLAGTGF